MPECTCPLPVRVGWRGLRAVRSEPRARHRFRRRLRRRQGTCRRPPPQGTGGGSGRVVAHSPRVDRPRGEADGIRRRGAGPVPRPTERPESRHPTRTGSGHVRSGMPRELGAELRHRRALRGPGLQAGRRCAPAPAEPPAPSGAAGAGRARAPVSTRSARCSRRRPARRRHRPVSAAPSWPAGR